MLQSIKEITMGKFNAEEISNFARFYGFHYDSFNPHALVKDVLIDMEMGLAGKSSSI
jgi:hexokinase